MDLAQIDMLIERLEKKKSLRPGSPPVSIDGHVGVWRMIRHNRVFIELDGKGGLGRILVGPPSFVGHKLNEIPSDVWQALTPRSTLKEFRNVNVAENGIETLKDSIKNSVGPEDTRRDSVDSMDTVEQLVPIARSTGFTDDEIKSALAGKAPNKPLSELSDRRSDVEVPAPSNVITFKPRAPKVEEEKPEVEADEGAPQLPKPDPAKLEQTAAFISDSLARIPEAVKGTSGDEKDKKVADILDKLIVSRLEKDPEEVLAAKRVKDLANGLRAGKYTLPEVEKEIKEVFANRARLKERSLQDKERAALEDGVKVKEFIDTFEEKIEEKVNEKIDAAAGKFKPAEDKSRVSDDKIRQLAEETRRAGEENVREAERQRKETARLREQAAAERQRAQEFMSEAQKARLEVDAAIELLNELAASVDNAKIQKELEDMVQQISSGGFRRRSILLRLYQLLQILLLLIPGL
jgi:hypothetical protein